MEKQFFFIFFSLFLAHLLTRSLLKYMNMVYIFSCKYTVDWFQLNIVCFLFRKNSVMFSTHHNILELDTPLSIANCFYSTILLTKTNSTQSSHTHIHTHMCILVRILCQQFNVEYILNVCKQIYTSVHSVSILN